MLSPDQIAEEIRQMSRPELEAYAQTLTSLYNQQTKACAAKISVPIADSLRREDIVILSQLAGMTLRGFKLIAKFDLASATNLEINDEMLRPLVDREFIVDSGASIGLTQNVEFVEIPNYVFIP